MWLLNFDWDVYISYIIYGNSDEKFHNSPNIIIINKS